MTAAADPTAPLAGFDQYVIGDADGRPRYVRRCQGCASSVTSTSPRTAYEWSAGHDCTAYPPLRPVP